MNTLLKITGFFMVSLCCTQLAAQGKGDITARTRLSKVSFKGNDFTAETTYQYDSALRIAKIIYKQNNKLFNTIADFVFDKSGQLVSYITTYPGSKIPPSKTTITYDNNKRPKQLVVNRTDSSEKQPFISSMDYSWKNDTTLVVTNTKWFLGKIKQDIVYTFNQQKNIEKAEGLGEASIAYVNQFKNYDYSANPLLLRGGFIEEMPLSKNNNSWEQLGSERYISTIKITYQKILVHKYVPGGPKIPTQYRNGLPLQAVTSWYDPDAKRTITTGTANYTYINLAP